MFPDLGVHCCVLLNVIKEGHEMLSNFYLSLQYVGRTIDDVSYSDKLANQQDI